MKIKNLQHVRQAELIAFLVGAAGQAYPVYEHLPKILNNGMNALMGNYGNITSITPENAEVWALIMAPFTIGTVAHFYVEKKTEEYQSLKEYYNKVIDNFISFAQSLDIKDPIEIFSLYVYLYRGGYLSYNHQFTYDIDMKDGANTNLPIREFFELFLFHFLLSLF